MSLIPLGFWAASGGGGAAGTFDLLETTTLASSAASVTFSGLDTLAAGYQHLQIRAVVKSTQAVNFPSASIRFNGYSTSPQYSHFLQGISGTVASSSTSSNKTVIRYVAGSAGDAWAGWVMDILDFSSPSKNTTTRSLIGFAETNSFISLSSSIYPQTSAVTSFEIFEDTGFQTGTRFSLYGIKGA